ncbi:MAG TPA: hypothetical protein VNV65_06570 [Candidatus Solibacter sp.]|jgi:hypothetical protein|nr:hypothetical protein [Candidatus Solibacter sp.]
MSKLIYAEPDDEITNLVDRLRSEKAEKELVFVLPGASRVMHSNLNARLLKQYSNSLGKTTSVISPDPRTQSIAIETGFSVFPTMAAFESGKALDRAVDSSSAAEPAGILAPLPAAADPSFGAPSASMGRAAPPPAPVRTPRPKPEPRTLPAVTGGRAGYLPYVLGGVGVLLILIILGLFVLPSATVQIVIPARAIAAQPTVTGQTAAPGPSDSATVQTTIQQGQEQMQQANIPSTGQKTIPAAPATGNVVFTYTNPGIALGFDLPKGTEVTTDDGKKYQTQADSGNIGRNQSSPPIPVAAETGGASTNTPAGSIKNITGNPNPDQLKVTNPSDVTGGADATQQTVVSQTDQDKVKKTLGDQLTTKVQADLQKTAGSQRLLAETLVVSVDASYDHKPGDNVPNFTATVTVKASETSLDDAKVKQVLTDALKKQAPAGYTLIDTPKPKLAYTVAQHDDKGGVILNGTASGFMATAINKDDIRTHITGKSIKQARAYIQGNLDSSNVIITESPSLVPWLPFMSSRISVNTTVENATPG